MGITSEDTTQQAAQELVNEQIAENKAELERKKESLYQTRLDIIKGQGGENWTPNTGSRYSGGGGNSIEQQQREKIPMWFPSK